MARKVKSQKRVPLITRWTPEQKKAIERTSQKMGISSNELIERKVFGMPLNHPTKIVNR